jgi:hypothetical protein
VQQGVDATETLLLSAVTTGTTDVVRGTGPLASTFADLGDGDVYASAEVSTVQGPSMSPDVVINVEPSAVEDFNQARIEGGYFVIGASLSSLHYSDDYGNETLFGCTGRSPAALDVLVH